jgi:hypothetical protein
VSELKPGEYVGADGRVHRAHLNHSVEHGDGRWWPAQSRVLPSSPDFPAAIEALQALVPEPFEWEVEPGYWPRRWNGDRVQAMDNPGEIAWSDTSVVETAAFNAGRRYERERGHADE